ncbi:MAG: fructosamine kinase family protein [Phycisphaerales bacterium]|nr:fructosamine kinase family protein [Phycisphaerales bacterium]
MTTPAALRDALAAVGIPDTPTSCRSLSGGCIHEVMRIEFDGRAPVVCKRALGGDGVAQLKAECHGLRSLCELPGQPLVIPSVLGLGDQASGAVLVMEWIEPGSPAPGSWEVMGQALARMHEIDMGHQYGFEIDNFIGATPQVNTWSEDWVDFNRNCRLAPQVQWAREAGHLQGEEGRLLDQVIAGLDQVLPARPRASLLHGDLWSGNVLPMADGRMSIIDPACSVGDGWADIAMMQLFGGIPASCTRAYAEARTDDADEDATRLAVYQLYHLLNHLNLFGRGYLGQVMDMAKRILRVSGQG